ncbi:MAG: CDP-glycerol glycerophosphotransferase family protein [Petrotogales bacterium]
MVYRNDGLFLGLKKKMFWYLKEQNVFLLPFILFSIGLWYVLSEVSNWFISAKTGRPVIAFTGLYYNGNSRAVFEYLRNEYADKYCCYWIARNLKSFFDVKKNGGKVVYVYFPFSLASSILKTDVLVTNDSSLSFLFKYKKPKIVQLWHGVGFKGRTSVVEGVDVWCEASDFTKKRRIENYGIDENKIYVTGLARMDKLLNYLKDDSSKKKICDKLDIPYNRKIILYAPTWEVELFPFGKGEYKGFEKLCKFCESKNVVLILRQHPYISGNKGEIKKILKKYNMVYSFSVDIQPRIMDLLAVADVLITDLSSIATDFFLTKKPIVFMDVYKDYFIKSGAGSFIPLEYRAGEIIKTEGGLYDAMRIILEKGNRFEKEQAKALKKIHGDVDGRASERVTEVIEKILEED